MYTFSLLLYISLLNKFYNIFPYKLVYFLKLLSY